MDSALNDGYITGYSPFIFVMKRKALIVLFSMGLFCMLLA